MMDIHKLHRESQRSKNSSYELSKIRDLTKIISLFNFFKGLRTLGGKLGRT